MVSKIYSFLGLAAKAGKLLSGEGACEKTIKAEKAKLVIVAEDASPNTKKMFTDMCHFRNVDIRYFGQKEFLGRYTGKEIRSVIVLLEDGFAKHLIEMIDAFKHEDGGGKIVKS